jgi:3-phosphoshikimate 1-carboxyvinyltransferase
MGLAGRPSLPADKSIAHRAALFAALAEGRSEIVGFSDAADPLSTLACLRSLGVQIEAEEGSLIVYGRGLSGLTRPAAALDCGNSGTTMRLLAGVLAGQPFDSVLTGDESLSARPMGRVIRPLRSMGASIDLEDEHAPIRIHGQALKGITYEMPVASAQVKSAILLAGLYADGETTVIEPVRSRDHTERMLELDIFEVGGARHITVRNGHHVPPGLWVVPRDFSAAAFFLVGGAIADNCVIEMRAVGVNPTRSALLDVLQAMGARITIRNHREYQREPVADLLIENDGSGLHGVTIAGEIIPQLIDELPALAVAGAFAEGTTTIRDAGELRVKETDRIAATVAFLRAMDADVEELDDGMIIHGGRPLRGAEVFSEGDHRIAMAAGIAAIAASGETTIHGAEVVAISYPTFWEELAALTGAQP